MTPRVAATALSGVVLAVALTGCSATGAADDRRDGRPHVSWRDAADHAGERVRVCGPLRSTGSDGDDRFFNLGAAYPHEPRFTIVVWDNPTSAPKVTTRLRSNRACVTGKVYMHGSVPQIDLDSGRGIELTSR